jgi:hypothetical protein
MARRTRTRAKKRRRRRKTRRLLWSVTWRRRAR